MCLCIFCFCFLDVLLPGFCVVVYYGVWCFSECSVCLLVMFGGCVLAFLFVCIDFVWNAYC